MPRSNETMEPNRDTDTMTAISTENSDQEDTDDTIIINTQEDKDTSNKKNKNKKNKNKTYCPDYLDKQFQTMYYVIAIMLISIIIIGYYLYIKEGALSM